MHEEKNESSLYNIPNSTALCPFRDYFRLKDTPSHFYKN